MNKQPQIPDWDEFFFRNVYLTASKSRDPRTKIDSILVKNNIRIFKWKAIGNIFENGDLLK